MFVLRMLSTLRIRNYALISDVELHFDEGMNIITGETGAGKSILIKALGLVLGNRADTSVLRNSDKKCIVEAGFRIEKSQHGAFFQHHDLDFEQETIVRREISSSGKSRAFINDTPVNLKIQEEFGNRLIEVHSQHDSLFLFKKDFQFYFLDALSGIEERSANFSGRYIELKEKQSHLSQLIDQQKRMQQESDFNTFLLNELEEADISQGEENELNREQELLENAEDLIRSFSSAEHAISNSDQAITSQLAELERLFRSSRTDISSKLAERVREVIIELNDISSEVQKAQSDISLDPQRLEEVNDRLATLFELKQKHRVMDADDLLELKEQLEEKLGVSGDLELQIKQLQNECESLSEELKQEATFLHESRMRSKPTLESSLKNLLTELGMKHSSLHFEIRESEELNKYGKDQLELLLSSDNGESVHPIKQAASGGELSRINLCLKSLLAEKANIQSSVFDEIDTGVSGEIAHKVGGKLLQMTTNQQVIAVTHLVQIASLGQKHFHITKEEVEGKVETVVHELTGEQRIHEIAKMISGSNLTESALEQSRELMRVK